MAILVRVPGAARSLEALVPASERLVSDTGPRGRSCKMARSLGDRECAMCSDLRIRRGSVHACDSVPGTPHSAVPSSRSRRFGTISLPGWMAACCSGLLERFGTFPVYSRAARRSRGLRSRTANAPGRRRAVVRADVTRARESPVATGTWRLGGRCRGFADRDPGPFCRRLGPGRCGLRSAGVARGNAVGRADVCRQGVIGVRSYSTSVPNTATLVSRKPSKRDRMPRVS